MDKGGWDRGMCVTTMYYIHGGNQPKVILSQRLSECCLPSVPTQLIVSCKPMFLTQNVMLSPQEPVGLDSPTSGLQSTGVYRALV